MTDDPTGTPIRVIVVDDSRLMRRLIVSGLEADGAIRVIAEAGDTVEARKLIRDLSPDVITLDVEMPGMNGIEFLKKIMELKPMPVIMVSTLTAAGADISLSALNIGAVDAIQKPAGREMVSAFGRDLREKVRLASRARVRPRPPKRPAQVAAAPRPLPPAPARRKGTPELIAVGASTGGVAALGTLLSSLPGNTPPIMIAQHMPPTFTGRLAARLDGQLPHRVAEATDGEVLRTGDIRIAPGDHHLCATRTTTGIRVKLDDSGEISGHKPSVDVLFNSISTSVGGGALGIILTGMGRDGAAGLRAMRRAGAYCIGQSEDSCVVYGMPRVAAELGAIDEALDLAEIGPRICDFLNPRAGIKSA